LPNVGNVGVSRPASICDTMLAVSPDDAAGMPVSANGQVYKHEENGGLDFRGSGVKHHVCRVTDHDRDDDDRDRD
jgi:hypothetical protein